MPKYLVINRPPSPIPERANVDGCVTYFQQMGDDPRFEIYPIVGLKGYASLIEVDSHEELMKVLRDNPMGDIEEYTVLPLAPLEADE